MITSSVSENSLSPQLLWAFTLSVAVDGVVDVIEIMVPDWCEVVMFSDNSHV